MKNKHVLKKIAIVCSNEDVSKERYAAIVASLPNEIHVCYFDCVEKMLCSRDMTDYEMCILDGDKRAMSILDGIIPIIWLMSEYQSRQNHLTASITSALPRHVPDDTIVSNCLYLLKTENNCNEKSMPLWKDHPALTYQH